MIHSFTVNGLLRVQLELGLLEVMLCCGGAEEESTGSPANQYPTAPPRGGNTYGGGGNMLLHSYICFFFFVFWLQHWYGRSSRSGRSWGVEVDGTSAGRTLAFLAPLKLTVRSSTF